MSVAENSRPFYARTATVCAAMCAVMLSASEARSAPLADVTDEDSEQQAKPIEDGTPPGFQGAIGLGASWQQRQDYGSLVRSNFIPELVGIGYLPAAFAPRWYWRPGARIGYSGLEQAEYPQGIVFNEKDLLITSELGLVYDGVVVPSLSVGAGVLVRDISARSSLPGVDVTSLERSEVQPLLYVQAGVGVSFGSGALVLEPYVRLEKIRRDSRSLWRFGLDATVLAF